MFGLFHFTTSDAWSPVYPANRRALCLDLDTGALRWQVFQTNTERMLFEAYREGIVAYFKQRGREEAIPVLRYMGRAVISDYFDLSSVS